MIVKVSNPMTQFIREALNGIADNVRIVKLSADEYGRIVDYDLIRHTDDWNGQTFKAIRVSYPAECYAMPVYITTRDLVTTFHESDGSAAGFTRKIQSQYAI